MCPKPFSWAKNKRKLFSDGKSRGQLLARAAPKTGYALTERHNLSPPDGFQEVLRVYLSVSATVFS